MIRLPERQRRFATATAAARIGFLTAAGERIMPIYEKHHVGEHVPEMQESLDLGWRQAGGQVVSAADVRRCRRAVNDLVQYYNEESIAILSRCATLALRVLQCIEAVTTEDSAMAAARGYAVLIEAAQNVDIAIDREERSPNSASVEELAWLDAAVCRAETWNAPVTRDTFRDLGDLPPRWWSAYETASSPLG